MKDIRRMVEEALDNYITEDMIQGAVEQALDNLDIEECLVETLTERVSNIVGEMIVDYVSSL